MAWASGFPSAKEFVEAHRRPIRPEKVNREAEQSQDVFAGASIADDNLNPA